MGSHVEDHFDVRPTAAAGSLSTDSGDVEEGWSGVQLALAYVDEMVGGLADVTNDVDLSVVDGDAADWDEVFIVDDVLTSSRQPRSPLSVQLTADSVHNDEEDKDNSHRCISDACELL